MLALDSLSLLTVVIDGFSPKVVAGGVDFVVIVVSSKY